MTKQTKLTGLWMNETPNGDKYMSGKTQDGKRFTVWKNKFFDADTEAGKNPPHYNLFIDND